MRVNSPETKNDGIKRAYLPSLDLKRSQSPVTKSFLRSPYNSKSFASLKTHKKSDPKSAMNSIVFNFDNHAQTKSSLFSEASIPSQSTKALRGLISPISSKNFVQISPYGKALSRNKSNGKSTSLLLKV